MMSWAYLPSTAYFLIVQLEEEGGGMGRGKKRGKKRASS